MDTDPATLSMQEVDTPSEPAQAEWARIEGLLRRLATRLTYAAEGRGSVLDGTLHHLRNHLRAPLGEADLQVLLTALTDAVRLLDTGIPPVSPPVGTPPPAATTVAPALDAIRAPLLVLIDRLRMDQIATTELVAIRDAINRATDADTLAAPARSLADLICRDLQQVAAQQAAARELLTQVTWQLDELTRYLTRDSADHRDGATARRQLDQQLHSEIDALGNHLQSAADVGSLQREIQARLSAITTHLKGFHAREEERTRNWQTRSEQMSQRIHELERSAHTMQVSLRQEHQLASTDQLTGIANRMVFDQHMARICAQPADDTMPACLIVLDIDHFKLINDRFGHAAGDRALRIVAEQLRDALRTGDLLARYGGEEFAVVLMDTNAQTGQRIAEALRQRVERTSFRCKEVPVSITLSAGVAPLYAGDTPESVFERADRALYQAKREGRNRCVVLIT